MGKIFDADVSITVLNITPKGRETVAEIKWPNRNSKKVLGGNDIFALEDFDHVDEDLSIRRSRDGRFNQMKKIRFDKKIIVINDVWVFPEDNLKTFSRKISHATKIPTYRQHIWFETDDGEVVNPVFNTIIGYSIGEVDINKIYNQDKMIFNIPIDMEYYDNRANIKIESDEMSMTMGDIMLAYGSKIKWYVCDIDNFFENKQIISNAIGTDKYMFDLLYYGFVYKYWPNIPFDVFHVFISNELDIVDQYPNMVQSQSILAKSLILETQLISKNYMPKLPPKSQFGLDESEIMLLSSNNHETINTNAIFNNIKLTQEMPYSSGRLVVSDKLIEVEKKITGTDRKPRQQIYLPVGSIMFMIVLDTECEICTIIGNNGTVRVKIFWTIQKMFTMERIAEYVIKYVNPLIIKINKHSSLIKPFDVFGSSNFVMRTLRYKIFMKIKMTNSSFNELKNKIDEYRFAGIFMPLSSSHNSIIFRPTKGTNIFDMNRFWKTSLISNYYSYPLSNHTNNVWESIFVNNKRCEIELRSIDISITLNNVFESEIAPVMRYILMLIDSSINTKTEKENTFDESKNLKILKLTDPILFDMRKLYGTEKTYSQICQNPNQPSMVDEKTKGSVKYWNFTENRPQYYKCDSKKYNQFYFKTGWHPLGFCLPCCKKINMNEDSKYKKITDECLKNRKYIVDKRNVTKSNYIVAYGKYLENNRLSRLPEKTLEQIFHKQYDDTAKGFYIIGTPQNFKFANNVGIVNIICTMLEKSIDEIISDISKFGKFKILMDGEITKYFKNKSDLVGELTNIFVAGGLTEFNKWNELFISIMKYIYGIIVIQFADISDNINIVIPSNIKNSSEFISNKYKYIFVIKKNNIYLPIYLVNKIASLNKTKHDVKAVFDVYDKIIGTMKTIISNILVSDNNESKMVFSNIFESGKNIEKIITTSNGNGIGVVIDGIWIPVHESNVDNVDIIKTPEQPSRNDTSSVDVVIKLISEFGITKPDSLLKLGESYVGFIAENLYFHTMPFDTYPINVPVKTLFYDPIDINKVIKKSSPPNIQLFGNLNERIYRKQMYRIFVVNFISKIKSFKNDEIRNRIFEKLKNSVTDIEFLATDWKSDYDYISFVYESQSSKSIPNEYIKLAGIKCNEKNISSIREFIKRTVFNFDNIAYLQLLDMSLGDIKNKIKEILPIKFGMPVIKNNIENIVSCETSTADYCDGDKVIISQEKYDKYVDILANDIKNPIKQKNIFFIISGSDNFKFIDRPNEIIKIKI